MRRGFSLIELLVCIAIIAVLLAILIPTLAQARSSARALVCATNLRQTAMACSDYAAANEGFGPAIGWPWTAWPNWGVVALEYAGERRSHATDVFENESEEPTDSIIICPEIQLFYSQTMTRTYAMNGTGHGGRPGDAGNYDAAVAAGGSGRAAAARFDLVERPSATAMLVDAAVSFFPSNAPPPTRCASVIDFRDPVHVEKRLGVFHAGGRLFNGAMFDGSVRSFAEAPEGWDAPLP